MGRLNVHFFKDCPVSVVVADEEFDGTNVILYLLGERQRGAYEARKALSQGVVESFDVVGFPCFFRDGFVALCWNHTIVHFISYGSPIFKVVREKRCKALYTPAKRSPTAPECALVRG